jgi:tetratricopeptide (TPR) repeat protein
MAEPGFNAVVETARLAAARGLPASCLDDFQRLSRSLVYGPAFQWLLVDAPDDALRKQLMAALDEVLHAAGLRSNRLPLSDKVSDVAMLEKRLLKNAGQADVVHVVGRSGWFSEARWDAFNLRRERLASEAQARLVFWLDADAIALASRGAPDLWAWRGGVYRFEPDGDSLQRPLFAREATVSGVGLAPFYLSADAPDNRSIEQRQERVAEIRNWLATVPAPPDELLAAPTRELGRLLFSLGDYEAALTHLRSVQLPLYERLGDVHAKAITWGEIADILRARGQLDEALRILSDEVLPAFEHLGDLRDKAITLGKIADVLQARGQLDEALRLHEERLPTYKQLGDVGGLAQVKYSIARVRLQRGDHERGGLQAIRDGLAEAFEINQLIGRAEGIGAVGSLLAQVLAFARKFDEALVVLTAAEAAYRTLADPQRLAQVQALQKEFEAARLPDPSKTQ